MFTQEQLTQMHIKRGSIVTITCKNAHETNVYSGVINHTDAKHISFEVATRTSEHTTTPQFMEFFSIPLQYVEVLIVMKE